MSPLLQGSHTIKALNIRIAKYTSYYKPKLKAIADPRESIEEYPFDMQEEVLNEAMPKPLYTL